MYKGGEVYPGWYLEHAGFSSLLALKLGQPVVGERAWVWWVLPLPGYICLPGPFVGAYIASLYHSLLVPLGVTVDGAGVIYTFSPEVEEERDILQGIVPLSP